MPAFGAPLSGLASDGKLTHAELVRAMRFSADAEFEATQLDMQPAESTNNKLAAAVLKEVADEERVHAAEFQRVLQELAPDEAKFHADGAREVEEKIKKNGRAGPRGTECPARVLLRRRRPRTQ